MTRIHIIVFITFSKAIVPSSYVFPQEQLFQSVEIFCLRNQHQLTH